MGVRGRGRSGAGVGDLPLAAASREREGLVVGERLSGHRLANARLDVPRLRLHAGEAVIQLSRRRARPSLGSEEPAEGGATFPRSRWCPVTRAVTIRVEGVREKGP